MASSSTACARAADARHRARVSSSKAARCEGFITRATLRARTLPHGRELAARSPAIPANVWRLTVKECRPFPLKGRRHAGPLDPNAGFPEPGPGAALRAPAPDRQQHRQCRHPWLCGARDGLRRHAQAGDRADARGRRVGGCTGNFAARPHRARGRRARRAQPAVCHTQPDQPRPQHGRHGPRASQLRRQLGEVRGDAALHQQPGQDAAQRHHRPVSKREPQMSMLRIFNVAGSAVSAQSQRLNVVASNLANADTVAGPDGKSYKARQVVFQTVAMGDVGAAGVKVSEVKEDESAARRVHDPKHPQADAEGYVTYSNVNAVEEMVNMISASRSYQNNIEVMNTAKTLLQKTLQLGQ